MKKRHPRSLNQQDRSNSAPNVCTNSVKPLSDHQKLTSQIRGPLQFVSFQNQSNQEHPHSTQASPTNTLKHIRRQRARSADESNKNLLSPREQKSTDENWVSFFFF